jgi:hypothetical protein
MGLAEERGRGMIIALNKNDLLTKETAKRAEELVRDKISFAPFVPMVRMSAKTGRGVNELMAAVAQVRGSFKKRVGTGELNRFFAEALELRPPPTMGAKAPRLYYITQAEHSPPKFVVITNAPDSVHFSYQRFVINQLRKRFGFEGVPVRVIYKAKRKTDRAERLLAKAEATAEVRPRQKINATTRARSKERLRAAAPSKRPARSPRPRGNANANVSEHEQRRPMQAQKSSSPDRSPRAKPTRDAKPSKKPVTRGRSGGREKSYDEKSRDPALKPRRRSGRSKR